MELSVVQIGNSKGIRLSKTILEKYDIKDSVEVILEKEFIVLKAKDIPRKGWDKSFRKMHERGDDTLLINDVFDDENSEGWT